MGTVTVNDQRCHRDPPSPGGYGVASGEHFWIQLPVDNLADAVETNIFVYVVSNDVVASASGTLFVAKASEAVEHEATGALSAESRYAYTWDGYGRISSITATNASPNFKLEFTYYPDGQRATKKVSEWTGSEWSVVRSHSYVYDGWNLIWERVTNSTTSTVSTRHYTWGLDLAGRRSGKWGQQAGGIGGLVAITVSSSSTNSTTSTYLPISDHNGNIHHLVDANTKEIVASYTYSPFGVLVGKWGPAKDVCPFRFMSKYYDRETELYYFGYRYYDPASTKWLSNDPLGEEGGIPLNGFCGNDPVNKWDALGEIPLGEYIPQYERMSGFQWIVQVPAEIARLLSVSSEPTDIRIAMDWTMRAIMTKSTFLLPNMDIVGPSLMNAVLSVPDAVGTYQGLAIVGTGVSAAPRSMEEVRSVVRNQVISHALNLVEGFTYGSQVRRRTTETPRTTEDKIRRAEKKIEYYKAVEQELLSLQKEHTYLLGAVGRVWRGKLKWEEKVGDTGLRTRTRDFGWIRKKYPWYTRWATIRSQYTEAIAGREMSIEDMMKWFEKRKGFWQEGALEMQEMIKKEQQWIQRLRGNAQ